MERSIDLNCDLGETVGGRPTADDAALFEVVTSASVACGFHAGDLHSMRESCRRAAGLGAAVGAHVSYRDREGFGRRPMDVAGEDLLRDLTEQIAALADAAADADTRVSYVKPHGALYNRIAVDAEHAEVVVAAARAAGLPLLGLPGSAVEAAATRGGVEFFREAFPDRGYLSDGTLAPRGTEGAVIDDPAVVAARALRMIVDGRVDAVDGGRVALEVDSLCVHGDTPGSVAIARSVRGALEGGGVRLGAFA